MFKHAAQLADGEFDLPMADANHGARSEPAHQGNPGTRAESQHERERRRRNQVDPALKKKGWSVYRWEKEAGVSSKTGRRYIDGDTLRLGVDTHKKLSESLGIDLPE